MKTIENSHATYLCLSMPIIMMGFSLTLLRVSFSTRKFPQELNSRLVNSFLEMIILRADFIVHDIFCRHVQGQFFFMLSTMPLRFLIVARTIHIGFEQWNHGVDVSNPQVSENIRTLKTSIIRMQDESSNYVRSNVWILTRILKLETQRP
mgnify:CR=1 FL=1